MKNTFKVSQIRDLLNQVYNEKITFSRFVEILNEQKEENIKNCTPIVVQKDFIKTIKVNEIYINTEEEETIRIVLKDNENENKNKNINNNYINNN